MMLSFELEYSRSQGVNKATKEKEEIELRQIVEENREREKEAEDRLRIEEEAELRIEEEAEAS